MPGLRVPATKRDDVVKGGFFSERDSLGLSDHEIGNSSLVWLGAARSLDGVPAGRSGTNDLGRG